MFATFTKENNLRGTYILKSDNPKGPFVPHSHGAVTPYEWECLDDPFMYRTTDGTLLKIWSTFIGGEYAECIAKSDDGGIDGNFVHLDPLITDDGGHGMIFTADNKLMLTFHSPNKTNFERPVFNELIDIGDIIKLK